MFARAFALRYSRLYKAGTAAVLVGSLAAATCLVATPANAAPKSNVASSTSSLSSTAPTAPTALTAPTETEVSEKDGLTTYREPDGSYRAVQTPVASSPVSKGAQPNELPGGNGGAQTAICQLSSGANAANGNCNVVNGDVYKIGWDGTDANRVLLQSNFDWSQFRDENILSVQLRFDFGDTALTPSTAAAPTLRLYSVTKPWNQFAANWTNTDASTSWTTPGGDFDTTTTAYSAPGFTSSNGQFNLTALAKNWIAGTTVNDGFLIKEPTENVNVVENIRDPSIQIIYMPQQGIQSAGGEQTRHLTDAVDSSIDSADRAVVVQGSVLSIAGIGVPLNLGYAIGGDGNAVTNFSTLDTVIGENKSLDGSIEYQTGDGNIVGILQGPSGTISPPGMNTTVTQTGTPGQSATVKIRFNDTGITNTYSNTGTTVAADLPTDATLPIALKTSSDSQGNTITYHYTGSVMTSITDTQGRTINIGSYANPQYYYPPTSVTDVSSGHTVSLYWSDIEHIDTVTNADSHVTSFTYASADGIGRRYLASVHSDDDATTVDKADYAFLSTSDPKDYVRLNSITYGAHSTASSQYTFAEPDTTHVTMTDPNGGVTTYTHDPALRVTSVVDPLGHTQSTSWTPMNSPQSRTDGLSAVTSYTYNSLNSVTKVTSPAGAGTAGSQSFTYPTSTGSLSDYQPSTSKDAQGNSTTYSYNSTYELASTTTPGSAGGTPTNHYKGDSGITCTNAKTGELCSSVDGNGNTTSYTYDTAGNPATVTAPSPLGVVTYGYDADGRQTSKIDGAGNHTYTTYDGENRITKVSSSSTACPATTCVSYTYNGAGWLTQRVDPSGTTTYTYDSQGHPLTMNTPTGNTSYTYDGNGNLTSYTDAGGTVTYTYDAANRVITLAAPGGSCPASPAFPNTTNCTKFGYDNADRRTSTSYPNGQTIAIVYDAAGRETKVTAKNSAATVLASRTYSYLNGAADMDLRHSVTDTAGVTTTYTYDAMNRVLSATNSATTQSWTYDNDGNRLAAVTAGVTTAAKYNAADELCYTATTNTAACGSTPTGGTSYTYNGNGSMTASTGTITAATYTPFDQTASTTSGGTTSTNTYSDISSDQRTAAGGTTFANGQLGVTRSSTASVSTEFVRDPSGAIIAMKTSSGWDYYTADALGSTILLTSSTGASVATYTYDTWGKVTNTLTSDGIANPWQYAGGYADASGLVKFGTRYYNPTLGRFTQQDPSGQESNAYVYAADNPVNQNDPSGLRTNRFQAAAEIALGAALVSIGLTAGSKGASEIIAGLIFAPETFGFTALATVLGIAEAISAVAAVTVGTVLVLDGGTSLIVGHHLFRFPNL